MATGLPKRKYLTIIGFFGVAVLLAGAVLFTRPGLPARQAVVERILAEKLGQPVDVRGNVSLDLGNAIGISISEAYFASYNGEDASADRRAFEQIAFDAPYGLLLGQTGGVSNFEISGISFDFARSAQPLSEEETGFPETLVTGLLANPFYENIKFANAAFTYSDAENGWNEKIFIEELKVETPDSREASSLTMRAFLNETPMTLSGSIRKSVTTDALLKADVALHTTSPAFSASLTGVADYSNPIAQFDGLVTTETNSLDALLSAFNIESAIEATGAYKAKLKGPVNELRQNDLTLSLNAASGTRLTVMGDVVPAAKDEAIDLTFSVDLGPPPDQDTDAALALSLTGVAGRLRGSFQQVELLDGKIKTSAAILDLDEIGPISAERIVKNADGTVGLIGLAIKNGPRDAPNLALSGEIGDLVDLRQIQLTGTYAFPTTSLFVPVGQSGEDLGTLTGSLSLDNFNGQFGLKDLTGQVSGTDLFALTYELSVPEFRRIDELAFEVSFSVPDFPPFLSAIGGPDRPGLQPVDFNGRVSLSDSVLAMSGDMISGKSQLKADLSLSEPDTAGNWLLGGTIVSDKLDFTDFQGPVELAGNGISFKKPDVEITVPIEKTLRAELDLLIKQLVSGGKKAGDVKGKLTYEKNRIALAPLSLSYLGGTINGDFGADLSSAPVNLSASGRVEKFRFGQLLRELGQATDFNSTAYLSFDVSGSGASARTLGKTLSGKVSGSLWGGVLPNRLLDLSGLNLVTWLSTGGSGKTSKLVCAVLPFQFKNGTATTETLILETEDVQVVGSGQVNLKADTLKLGFLPRPKRKQLVEIVSPFELEGPIGKPKLTVRDAGAGRAIGEVLSMPLSLLGKIFQGTGPVDETAKPCVLPKTGGPK
ncbi:AsmA family protein [Roseibium alexandrii]|uniref:Uncharacterized protein involved in outer membrane biogenesis n=1 Tax=Roseibium alexandrii (strain DSM 17067 / NCIMB 14079 / DFL-11) TaxID=244592 RepID=A0A5E8GZC8_ROSAD|nr:AsmA-like C-terminal region-containing protein [Roseibium alexandrii]EEE44839.1 Uncharacterized protein involved in outer membrane biogenesis [Roseibium alexandrii DFL-11]